MKCFALFSLLAFVLAVALVGRTEASFCPCDLSKKEQVCGSNGVTYKNRCEFECTQRDYRKLGRKLDVQKIGPC
ncbi:agrin-like [Scaptodrosophila lebanonensis]|uniref:Agrin-like n=1 Tax=Drosophila lebanonensis TaxID=7225 RepID=A0A6J2U4V9_DROLE|nr:agrin-like [Scaptodrosophila lebanonensis]